MNCCRSMRKALCLHASVEEYDRPQMAIRFAARGAVCAMTRIAAVAVLLIATGGHAAEWAVGADGDNRHTFVYLARIERRPLSRGAELVFSQNVSYLHYDAADV